MSHRPAAYPRRSSGARRSVRARSRSSTNPRVSGGPRAIARRASPPSARRWPQAQIDAVLIHAVYLLNCASEDPDIRAKSLTSLTHSLRVGQQIGAAGVVLHPGSAKTGDVERGCGARGRDHRRGFEGERGVPAAPGEHRRYRRHAGALGRGARRALEAAGGGARLGCALTPAICSPRAMTSAPAPAWTSCGGDRREDRPRATWLAAPQRLADAAWRKPRPPRQRRRGRVG